MEIRTSRGSNLLVLSGHKLQNMGWFLSLVLQHNSSQHIPATFPHALLLLLDAVMSDQIQAGPEVHKWTTEHHQTDEYCHHNLWEKVKNRFNLCTDCWALEPFCHMFGWKRRITPSDVCLIHLFPEKTCWAWTAVKLMPCRCITKCICSHNRERLKKEKNIIEAQCKQQKLLHGKKIKHRTELLWVLVHADLNWKGIGKWKI